MALRWITFGKLVLPLLLTLWSPGRAEDVLEPEPPCYANKLNLKCGTQNNTKYSHLQCIDDSRCWCMDESGFVINGTLHKRDPEKACHYPWLIGIAWVDMAVSVGRNQKQFNFSTLTEGLTALFTSKPKFSTAAFAYHLYNITSSSDRKWNFTFELATIGYEVSLTVRYEAIGNYLTELMKNEKKISKYRVLHFTANSSTAYQRSLLSVFARISPGKIFLTTTTRTSSTTSTSTRTSTSTVTTTQSTVKNNDNEEEHAVDQDEYEDEAESDDGATDTDYDVQSTVTNNDDEGQALNNQQSDADTGTNPVNADSKTEDSDSSDEPKIAGNTGTIRDLESSNYSNSWVKPALALFVGLALIAVLLITVGLLYCVRARLVKRKSRARLQHKRCASERVWSSESETAMVVDYQHYQSHYGAQRKSEQEFFA